MRLYSYSIVLFRKHFHMRQPSTHIWRYFSSGLCPRAEVPSLGCRSAHLGAFISCGYLGSLPRGSGRISEGGAWVQACLFVQYQMILRRATACLSLCQSLPFLELTWNLAGTVQNTQHSSGRGDGSFLSIHLHQPLPSGTPVAFVSSVGIYTIYPMSPWNNYTLFQNYYFLIASRSCLLKQNSNHLKGGDSSLPLSTHCASKELLNHNRQ